MLVLYWTALILIGLVLVDEFLVEAIVWRVCSTVLHVFRLVTLEIIVVLSK